MAYIQFNFQFYHHSFKKVPLRHAFKGKIHPKWKFSHFLLEVWNFLACEKNRDADVEDSAAMQRQSILKSLQLMLIIEKNLCRIIAPMLWVVGRHLANSM